jgi:hypothetical protein
MYQRADFSGARKFIGEQLLLKSFFYIIHLKRAKELALLLLCEFRQGKMIREESILNIKESPFPQW